ncbi:AAA ATPase domain-containing protein [Microvirga guangxiensis]|uniref:AAA ATPase domain-containing protein n=1 Tax=Microvirga guangxiensis TaxID=549386 RepID=A0A1G5HPP9_9HYPH|nr:AAA ATPase domain-containing protein [Microvirga guangxiensis]
MSKGWIVRLKKARVQNYRSIRDTGEFEIESTKTIMVGPNEAGKSAILQALQQIHAPQDVKGFDALRDYPRALYNDVTTGKVNPENVPVTTVTFELEDSDKALLPEEFRSCEYHVTRYLDNSATHWLTNGPQIPTYGSVKKDLLRLASHVDSRVAPPADGQPSANNPSAGLIAITSKWADDTKLDETTVEPLKKWLQSVVTLVDEEDEKEEKRLDGLLSQVEIATKRDKVLKTLDKRIPVFVLFSNYFRVRPVIHLAHLAQRLATKVLDDEQYDYGNACLLKLLGFTAKALSDLGRAPEPDANNPAALQAYRDQLDKRTYQLNAASVRLTNEIRSVWNPNPDRAEADRLRVQADGQYLKVAVEDDLGVEIELDQRSEGFQWLVSFFIVFFAEAADRHENAILLLDEPGLSLHALKQRDFRDTISRLAAKNQTIYTTHSPFLVGPDELDLVRVVEMTDRTTGTKVHTSVTSSDPAALLPLQEALGYDLAQSLFAQQRNLLLEGLTDYWYLEAVADLLAEAGSAKLNDKIALIPSNTASKVVYFATILHAHNLKVAALLDSDSAGDQAANQEVLVHSLGQKAILRTKDYIEGNVTKPEVEDLLRDTLVIIAKDALGIDVTSQAAAQPERPIVDLLSKASRDFSKYKLAKAFMRWSRDHIAGDLSETERRQWTGLISAINSALK